MFVAPRRVCALLVLTGAACANGADNTPVVDASSPPPAVTPRATPAEWQVTEQGLGPFHAGMTVAEVAAVVPGAFASPSGAAASECEYARWSAAPAGVHVMLLSGTVGRVDVDSQTIATAAGAKVGDSEARIDSLYPGRVRRMPHKYTDGSYLVVLAGAPADTMDRIVFETDGGHVTTFRAGRFPPVEYVERCG